MFRAIIVFLFIVSVAGCAVNRSAQNVFNYDGEKVVVSIAETTDGSSLKETYTVSFNGREVGSASPPLFQKKSKNQKYNDPIVTSIKGKFKRGNVVAKRLLTVQLGGPDLKYEIYIDNELMVVLDVI